MGVKFIQTSVTGLIPNTTGLGLGLTQQSPTVIYISTNDTLATVTTSGYLNTVYRDFHITLNNYQMALVYTTDSHNVWLAVSVTGSGSSKTYSLVAISEPGSIATPTVANQIAYATNTLGALAALGLATALFNAGNISAGLSGTAGTLSSYPATATSGHLILAAVANVGNFNTTISSITGLGQAEVITIPDAGAATANFIISKSGGTQHITTGALQVDAGIISSGLATGGTAGGLTLYPATTTNGSLKLVPVGNVGNFSTTISDITGLGQTQVMTIPDVGAATGQFLVKTAALVSGNLVQASGTAGLVVDSGFSASSTTANSLQALTSTVTLTAANVIAAFATPQVLIPAVANKVAVILNAVVYTNVSTPFTTGVAPIIQYGTTIHGGGTIAVGTGLVTGDITAASSQIRTIDAAASTTYTGITNTAVTFSCSTAYAVGTGSTVTFVLTYVLVTATI